ncbi:MAG: hypothetical protein KJO82_06880 [Gammaproteobacteria bacterium]|nr:hypothetical protein [Gammaproteobacteria bacterium]
MTTLIATSVVRGSSQGESHGGVYLVDLEQQRVAQVIDWNRTDIDWQGRGWDRGLRGIAFDGDKVFIAASDELFVYDRIFNRMSSYRSAHLKHCHEIYRYKRRLYLTSTAFDAVLGFDLDAMRFSWGIRISRVDDDFRANPFLPDAVDGPEPRNELHLNNVHCTPLGLFVSGARTGGLLRYTGKRIVKIAALPPGCHNAQPYRDGILFNDTASDIVRFVSPDKQRAFHVPRYDSDLLTHTNLDDSRTARQAFARGLCDIGNGVIAAGSSPSTITLHDFESMQTTLSINLTMDVRNAIHGLEVWPFDVA